MKQATYTSEIFSTGVRSFYDIEPYQDILTWASSAIDFSEDVSAERKRLDLAMSPHLVEPLRCWEFNGLRRDVTVCGIEQHGKTLLEVVGVLYCMRFHPCSMLCVYPSDELATEINKTKYEPLIHKIPSLAIELSRPFSKKTDRYILDASTMFFSGAGVKITSKSCKIVVGDEIDQYPKIGNLDNLADMEKRTRSYSESMFFKTCTPTVESGPVWRSFLAGSQGYWTLRCQHCGEWTMRSCDFQNFQFESKFDEEQKIFVSIYGSERLICPKCRFEHTEDMKYKMNQEGKYVYKFPDRLLLCPSFQFGALCSMMPIMSWQYIAGKILECGKRADISAHFELDNSFKGLPYKEREVSGEDIESLKNHFYHEKPDPATIEFVFVVSDTQDLFSPTGVFALDCMDNLWLLEYSNIEYLWLTQDEREEIERKKGEPVVTVEDMVGREYLGIKPLFQVVDYRGHRYNEIADYAANHEMTILYAGTDLRIDPWKESKENRKIVFVDAKYFQRILIYELYTQKNKETSFLYLPDDLPEKFQKEISCVQPDNTRKNGSIPENWKPKSGAVHDAFDVVKMAYFGLEYAMANLDIDFFRVKKSPQLLRRCRNVGAAQERPKQNPVQKTSFINGWK